MLRLHPGVSQRLGAVLLGIAALGAWYCYMDIGTAVRVAFPLPPEVRLNAPPASTISTDRRHLAGDAASVFHSLFPAVAAGQRNASSRASAPLAVAGAPGSVQPPRPLRRTIPHTLHQSWKTAMIPSVWAPFVRSWVTLHPRWNYTFYSDDALRRFFVREMPEFLPAFDACDAICKVDFSRLGFMHSFGGVYADLDFEALRPLDALIDPPSAHEAMLAKVGAAATLLLLLLLAATTAGCARYSLLAPAIVCESGAGAACAPTGGQGQLRLQCVAGVAARASLLAPCHGAQRGTDSRWQCRLRRSRAVGHREDLAGGAVRDTRRGTWANWIPSPTCAT
jgi:hypothetical protein